MALVDRIAADITRVFLQFDHFAETHYWNGSEIRCVLDGETALKRKNNNVNDISWDNNTREFIIFTPVDGFPEANEPEPNTTAIFDKKQVRIRDVNTEMGMYEIHVSAYDPRRIM